MKIIYAQENIINTEGKVIFLAGPTPRNKEAQSWRPKAIEIFKELDFCGTLLIPEMRNGFPTEFEYAEQINWEHQGLEISDIIMFWIPRELKHMPAFTTNIEFGYWLAKDPNKIVLGFPSDAPKMDYIKYSANKANIYELHNLKDVIHYSIDRR